MSRLLYLGKIIGRVSYYVLVKNATLDLYVPQKLDIQINDPFA